MVTGIFVELTLLFVLIVLISGVTRLLRQPLIVGYVVAGVIAGPLVLNLLKSTDAVATFAQIGIVFLLFLVGLSLNPRVVKDVGKVSLATGIGQVLFTTVLGYGISRLLGFSSLHALYIAIALAFSSTIIVMKLLSDRNDLETLYGRISIGFLIVQDLIAIFILIAISSLHGRTNLLELASSSVLKGIGIILVLYLFGRYLLPRVTNAIAKSQEFLLIFSIGWCFAVAAIFDYFNFSIEAGALLAGITLSLSPYQYEIASRMRPLRDFFIVLFFVLLGSQPAFGNIGEYVLPALLFSAFVLIGNPLIVITLMGWLGHTRRNSFMAGLTVAQISEFSLVIVALGVKLNHLAPEILSLITLVAIITMTGSTYMIIYADKIYPHLSRYLHAFERKGAGAAGLGEHLVHRRKSHDVILFGHNRIGYDIMESLKKLKRQVLVVDYDPEVILALAREGHEAKYGDANDIEMLEELDLSKTKMVVSTIPNLETNLLILERIRKARKRITVIMVSHQIDDAITLYEHGAMYVMMPHFLGGKHISTMIEEYKFDTAKFVKEKALHLSHIKLRKKMGHEHPRHERAR